MSIIVGISQYKIKIPLKKFYLFCILSLSFMSFVKANNYVWRVEIETQNGEIPTFDVAECPPGNMGVSITNCVKVPCRLIIKNGGSILYDTKEYDETKATTIRVRGNASAVLYEKKSYKINLGVKGDLLCRGDVRFKDKDWLLLKQVGINNVLGFRVNEMLGLQWTPQYKMVDVYINSVYKGLYMLCESVKRNTECRLDVDKDGFIFEYDAYWWNEPVSVTSIFHNAMRYTFKYPKGTDITEEQVDFFKSFINNVELAIRDTNASFYLDYDSFARWILGQDIIGNGDSAGSNIYMTWDKNSLIKMANMWDFDVILLDSLLFPNKFSRVHTETFYYDYLFKDPTFLSLYIELYDQYANEIYQELHNCIDYYLLHDEGEELGKSYNRDKELYGIEELYFQEILEQSKNRLNYVELKLSNAVNELRKTLNTGLTASKSPKKKKLTKAFFNVNGIKTTNVKKGILIDYEGRKIIK